MWKPNFLPPLQDLHHSPLKGDSLPYDRKSETLYDHIKFGWWRGFCSTLGPVNTRMGDRLRALRVNHLNLILVCIQPPMADSAFYPLFKSVGLVWGLAAALALRLNSSNEPSELLQWPCHDDSTINIDISIISIIKYCIQLKSRQ